MTALKIVSSEGLSSLEGLALCSVRPAQRQHTWQGREHEVQVPTLLSSAASSIFTSPATTSAWSEAGGSLAAAAGAAREACTVL